MNRERAFMLTVIDQMDKDIEKIKVRMNASKKEVAPVDIAYMNRELKVLSKYRRILLKKSDHAKYIEESSNSKNIGIY